MPCADLHSPALADYMSRFDAVDVEVVKQKASCSQLFIQKLKDNHEYGEGDHVTTS